MAVASVCLLDDEDLHAVGPSGLGSRHARDGAGGQAGVEIGPDPLDEAPG